ncbi:hypothetical protein NDU88_007083 [Pleurodeles waltl]|uniref:Uncharacterized protein n=1 Tax=Pleurodeles waltl TaxID=8319 RepID=A0AAV7U197_PLEWA|nr:hypothetical protein NDU88_007083 [Pleurodeles waltl]
MPLPDCSRAQERPAVINSDPREEGYPGGTAGYNPEEEDGGNPEIRIPAETKDGVLRRPASRKEKNAEGGEIKQSTSPNENVYRALYDSLVFLALVRMPIRSRNEKNAGLAFKQGIKRFPLKCGTKESIAERFGIIILFITVIPPAAPKFCAH